MGRVPCDQCLRANEFAGLEPMCSTCFPGVHEHNIPFYTIYGHVSGQYLMGPGGAVGLNLLAVDKVLDYFDVPNDERLEFQMKVQTIANKVLATQHADAERKSNQK